MEIRRGLPCAEKNQHTCDASEACAHFRSSFRCSRAMMRPIPLGDNSERVTGCAKSAGLLISLGRGRRLFRGLRMLERVWDSPEKLTTEGQETERGRGGKVFW